jgi:serine/threonine-protein kinase SRPK3
VQNHSYRYFRLPIAIRPADKPSDIHPGNIFMRIASPVLLEAVEQLACTAPLSYKQSAERKIFLSVHMDNVPGTPVLGDFDRAVRGPAGPHRHIIQPNLLRAPEVMLRLPWSYSADIWNVGALVRLLLVPY